MLTEESIIEETVERVRKDLHSSLPLKNFPDESAIREKATTLMNSKEVKSEAWKKMMDLDLSFTSMGAVNTKIGESILRCVEDWILKNVEYKGKIVQVTQKLFDDLCVPIKAFSEAKQALDPSMELETWKKILEDKMKNGMEYFLQLNARSESPTATSVDLDHRPGQGDARALSLESSNMQQQQEGGKRRQGSEGATCSSSKKARTSSSPTVGDKTIESPAPTNRFLNMTSPISLNSSKKAPLTQRTDPNGSTHHQKALAHHDKNKSTKNLFKGMEFFLMPQPAKPRDPRTEASQSIGNMYDLHTLRKQIESVGGKIVSQMGTEQGKKVFLIANGVTFAKEHLIMYCQALNIPCVQYEWIRKCIEQNRLLEWSTFPASALLPYGGGIFECQKVATLQNHNNKPLRQWRIFFAFGDETRQVNQLVLHASEAIALHASGKNGELIPEGAQVIISNMHSVNAKLLEEAGRRRLPVVSYDWFVRTIVEGVVASYEEFAVKLGV